MKLLIAGCGYVGSEFAKRLPELWDDSEHELYALTRSADRVEELSRLGIKPLVGDWLEPSSLPQLPAVDGLLVAIPHRPADLFGTQTHVIGLQNLLAQLAPPGQPTRELKVVYLSTTGVYGPASGSSIVDETTPAAPNRPGSEVAVAAETWLEAWQRTQPIRLNILRLAGIYGRGRIPLIKSLLDGEPLAVPREGHLNLIHVVDIANLLVHAFRYDLSQHLYVVSDGVPVLREQFYGELARLCGIDQPVFVDPATDDSRQRRASDKRVNPQLLFSHWRRPLAFPDYRAGLADAVAAYRGEL